MLYEVITSRGHASPDEGQARSSAFRRSAQRGDDGRGDDTCGEGDLLLGKEDLPHQRQAGHRVQPVPLPAELFPGQVFRLRGGGQRVLLAGRRRMITGLFPEGVADFFWKDLRHPRRRHHRPVV